MGGSLRFVNSAVLYLVPVLLIVSACAPIIPATAPPLIPQTGPTEKPATETLAPTENTFQIILTPVKFTAKLFKGGSAEMVVEQDEKVSVEATDRIEVVKLDKQDEQSRSVLEFPDFLEVELFTNAVVLLNDVRQEAGGSTHVTLDLSRGHVFVRLNGRTGSRVTVETPDTTINTLEDGTEFNVCKAPDKLTCVQVKKGSVELVTKGKKEIIKAQEARFVFKGDEPSDLICAPNEIFGDWEERYRQSANAPTLSSMVAGLQELCSWQTMEGFPTKARKLYDDQFTTASTGWLQEKIDNYFIGYSTPEYYHVQVQAPEDHIVVGIPNQRTYADANIDLKASVGRAKNGNFLYGVVFRRSEEQYYAFAVSPSTKKWALLKSSSKGLETLKESTSDSIQGSDAEDTLRVVAKGSIFTLFLNGQLVYQLFDEDYERGEVGLFVQTVDNPSALVYFDSITVWEMPGPLPNSTPLTKENCFNDRDDDGDRFVDRDDPDCNVLDIVPVATAQAPLPPTLVPPTEYPTEPPTLEPPTLEPPTEIPPTDIPPTDIPPTDIPPTEPPPTEPPTEPPVQ